MTTNAIKLGVVGACGRMGQRIITLANESGAFDIVAAMEYSDHPQKGQDIGVIARIGQLNVPVTDTLDTQPDVVIDFSLPESTMKWIGRFQEKGVPVVIGTTGLSDDQIGQFEQVANNIAVLFAPNMSLGVNLLFQLVGQVAKSLGEAYDIEIAETHHRFKRDAPSGTALELARRIARDMGWEFPGCLVNGRSGKESLRQGDTIGMHAIRAGDTVGIHSIFYSTLGETIEIKHTAHTRDTFVRGALRGAQWLVGKNPGLYNMADVLGI